MVRAIIPIEPISLVIRVSGFEPRANYVVEWLDTHDVQPVTREVLTVDGSGVLSLSVAGRVDDVALRIGDYSGGSRDGPVRSNEWKHRNVVQG